MNNGIESIDETLKERGKNYGSFMGHAEIAQALKDVIHGAPSWSRCEPEQKEALEMIMHKIARIVNGDPNFHDSWHDIIGYTKLVADALATDADILATREARK